MIRAAVITFLGLGLVAGAASADPIDASTLSLTELQGVFDDIGSSINANNDESGDELFEFQSTGATASYIATVSFSRDLIFGFYDPYNTATKLKLFDSTLVGSPGEGEATHIIIEFSGFTIKSFDSSLSIIDTATFSANTIGFFIQSPHATSPFGPYYSESALNPTGSGSFTGENDHFLTYLGKGDKVNLDYYASAPAGVATNDSGHWYVAAETTPLNDSSDDFSDIVVQFESITPVPEPGTLALVGAAGIAFALIRRRRKSA